jgi:Ca2+-binding RTX toxin-like protein
LKELLPVSIHSYRRRIGFEQLESRRVLAGNLQSGLAEINAGRLEVLGSNKSDSIVVSSDGTNIAVKINKQSYSFAAADVTSIAIDGRKGNDRLEVDESISLPSIIRGDEGNDRLYGGSGSDSLDGGRGNDRIWGREGDDTIHARVGNDSAWGGGGNDVLFAGSGNDALAGGDGDDVLYGETGKDRLRGGLGNDEIFGGADKDLIWGDDGNDFLAGDGDKDKLWGGNGDDILRGGSGQDHLYGGSGNNFLDGGPGKDKQRDGQGINLNTQLEAQLADGADATGLAKFELEDDDGVPEMELEIEVAGAPPSTVLDILLGETLIGTLTTNEEGAGEIEFTTNPDEEDELPLPSGLEIDAGMTITVGQLSGTFASIG